MSRGVKAIALTVAILLTGGLVTGIALWSTGFKEADPNQTGLFDENGSIVENPGVMLTVNGVDISFDEYRYFYLTTKYYNSSGDPAFWESDFDGKKAADLKEQTENSIAQQIAILQIGKENGIELTKEEKQEILDTIAEDKKTFGAEFDQRLKNIFISSEELYIQVTENQTLMQKIQTEMATKLGEGSREDLYKQAISAQHILIAPATDTAASESQTEQTQAKSMEDARILADEVYNKIITSEDPIATFAQMRKEYDADSAGQPENGYTFVEGDMVDEFYDAARALKENEISKPVETQFGYHIILRTPLDKEYVDENLISKLGSQAFQTKVEELVKTFKIEPGEFYHLVSPQNLR